MTKALTLEAKSLIEEDEVELAVGGMREKSRRFLTFVAGNADVNSLQDDKYSKRNTFCGKRL